MLGLPPFIFECSIVNGILLCLSCSYLVKHKDKKQSHQVAKNLKKKIGCFSEIVDLGKTLGPRACSPIVPAVWLPNLTSRNDADKQKENNKILLFHLR